MNLWRRLVNGSTCAKPLTQSVGPPDVTESLVNYSKSLERTWRGFEATVAMLQLPSSAKGYRPISAPVSISSRSSVVPLRKART